MLPELPVLPDQLHHLRDEDRWQRNVRRGKRRPRLQAEELRRAADQAVARRSIAHRVFQLVLLRPGDDVQTRQRFGAFIAHERGPVEVPHPCARHPVEQPFLELAHFQSEAGIFILDLFEQVRQRLHPLPPALDFIQDAGELFQLLLRQRQRRHRQADKGE